MWNILLWIGAALWILLVLQFLINRLTYHALPGPAVNHPDRWPSVSLVIPARDEEKKIRDAVSSFCSQEYPDFEVIVVDDRSSDATPAILAGLQKQFPNLVVLRGEEPPPGWLGKPHALEEGRRMARGDWLLFADADVVFAPDVLRRAMAFVLNQKADMVFLLPSMRVEGALEAVLMSSLYFIGAALVPVFLAVRSPWKRFALGAGVFNMVRREALDACGAFESMKDMVADDVGLGYRVKGKGYRLAGALSGPLIRLRMYEGARGTLHGFSKNIYPILRSFPWFLPVPFVFGTILSFLPYIGFALGLAHGRFCIPAALSLALLHLLFAILALTFRQPWYITFTNPLRELGWWWIILRSAWIYHTRGIVWRGRVFRP